MEHFIILRLVHEEDPAQETKEELLVKKSMALNFGANGILRRKSGQRLLRTLVRGGQSIDG